MAKRENYNDLYLFMQVVREGSFTAAAQRLGLAPVSYTHLTLTLSTNAMVLEALFYKHNAGPLFKNGLADDNSYFAHRATDEFNPPRRCLPGERVIRSAP